MSYKLWCTHDVIYTIVHTRCHIYTIVHTRCHIYTHDVIHTHDVIYTHTSVSIQVAQVGTYSVGQQADGQPVLNAQGDPRNATERYTATGFGSHEYSPGHISYFEVLCCTLPAGQQISAAIPKISPRQEIQFIYQALICGLQKTVDWFRRGLGKDRWARHVELLLQQMESASTSMDPSGLSVWIDSERGPEVTSLSTAREAHTCLLHLRLVRCVSGAHFRMYRPFEVSRNQRCELTIGLMLCCRLTSF